LTGLACEKPQSVPLLEWSQVLFAASGTGLDCVFAEKMLLVVWLTCTSSVY